MEQAIARTDRPSTQAIRRTLAIRHHPTSLAGWDGSALALVWIKRGRKEVVLELTKSSGSNVQMCHGLVLLL